MIVNVQMNNPDLQLGQVVQICKLCYNSEVKIFDVMGQMVEAYKIFSNKQTLNISNLKTGVYFLQITADDGSRKNVNIVKAD